MIDCTKNLTINNPCPKLWSEMTGSETRRFCTHCTKHVHHLSNMSRPEAALLLHLKKGNLCAGYECDSRGEIRYTPVMSRLHALIQPVTVGLLSAVLGLLGIGCSSSTTPTATTQPNPGSTRMLMGDVAPPTPPAPTKLGEIAPQPDVRPPTSDIYPNPQSPLLMGKVAAPENTPNK